MSLIDDYMARFGGPPPLMIAWRPRAHLVWPLMEAALKRGRPVTQAEVYAALGTKPIPNDAQLGAEPPEPPGRAPPSARSGGAAVAFPGRSGRGHSVTIVAFGLSGGTQRGSGVFAGSGSGAMLPGYHELGTSRLALLLAGRAVEGLVPLVHHRSLAMREPLSWPYDTEATWRVWREHLETLKVPHVDELRLEAERELQRIARCRSEPPRSRSKPTLVPQDHFELPPVGLVR